MTFKVAPFRGGAGRALGVERVGRLVTHDDFVGLLVVYVAPGSARTALLVASGLTAIACFRLGLLGFVVAPGSWVLTCGVLRIWRRRTMVLRLDEASVEDTVVDLQKKGLAVKTEVEGQEGWVGLKFSELPDGLLGDLRRAWGSKLRIGPVQDTSLWTSVVLLVFLCGILAVLVGMLLKYGV